VGAVLLLTPACGGGSGPAGPVVRPTPDLASFLRLPVATPSACPSSVNGTTSGRTSPWVGRVDVSVYLKPTASPGQVSALATALRAMPEVKTVYFESKAQAYAEFQRLYTCTASVPGSDVPASYRLVLHAVTTADRDAFTRRVLHLAGVDTVACDPSDPCVGVANGH
jgi:cell division protein FtsX